MQTDYKTKDVRPETAKAAPEEFFFPGSQEFLPMTIKAPTREEAEKIWEKERKKAA